MMVECVVSLEGGYVAPWSHCASWSCQRTHHPYIGRSRARSRSRSRSLARALALARSCPAYLNSLCILHATALSSFRIFVHSSCVTVIQVTGCRLITREIYPGCVNPWVRENPGYLINRRVQARVNPSPGLRSAKKYPKKLSAEPETNQRTHQRALVT